MGDIVFFITEHAILCVVWLIFLVLSVLFTIKNIFIKTKIINNIEAIKLINQDNAILIDTRSVESFKKGHIINSINIPKKYILLGKIKEIEIYKSLPLIIIFDESYGYDEYIKIFLKHGFDNVFILKSGIHGWNLDYLPLIIEEK